MNRLNFLFKKYAGLFIALIFTVFISVPTNASAQAGNQGSFGGAGNHGTAGNGGNFGATHDTLPPAGLSSASAEDDNPLLRRSTTGTASAPLTDTHADTLPPAGLATPTEADPVLGTPASAPADLSSVPAGDHSGAVPPPVDDSALPPPVDDLAVPPSGDSLPPSDEQPTEIIDPLFQPAEPPSGDAPEPPVGDDSEIPLTSDFSAAPADEEIDDGLNNFSDNAPRVPAVDSLAPVGVAHPPADNANPFRGEPPARSEPLGVFPPAIDDGTPVEVRALPLPVGDGAPLTPVVTPRPVPVADAGGVPADKIDLSGLPPDEIEKLKELMADEMVKNPELGSHIREVVKDGVFARDNGHSFDPNIAGTPGEHSGQGEHRFTPGSGPDPLLVAADILATAKQMEIEMKKVGAPPEKIKEVQDKMKEYAGRMSEMAGNPTAFREMVGPNGEKFTPGEMMARAPNGDFFTPEQMKEFTPEQMKEFAQQAGGEHRGPYESSGTPAWEHGGPHEWTGTPGDHRPDFMPEKFKDEMETIIRGSGVNEKDMERMVHDVSGYEREFYARESDHHPDGPMPREFEQYGATPREFEQYGAPREFDHQFEYQGPAPREFEQREATFDREAAFREVHEYIPPQPPEGFTPPESLPPPPPPEIH